MPRAPARCSSWPMVRGLLRAAWHAAHRVRTTRGRDRRALPRPRSTRSGRPFGPRTRTRAATWPSSGWSSRRWPSATWREIADLAEAFLKSVLGEDPRASAPTTWPSSTSESRRGSWRCWKHVVAAPFERMTYTEAVAVARAFSGQPFRVSRCSWGIGSPERARALPHRATREAARSSSPTTRPRSRPSTCTRTRTASTVRAMDVLVPRIGEIVGGSQREHRASTCSRTGCSAHGLDPEAYWWYLDLRRQRRRAPHAGFGLGFERLVQFATGHGEHPRRDPVPARAGARGVLAPIRRSASARRRRGVGAGEVERSWVPSL